MNRQRINPGQRIIHNLTRPLSARLKSRKHCGPYIVTPPTAGREDTRFFYMGSDFAPGLRARFCDEVAQSIQHTGWFTDEYGTGDTIRGLVFSLPHARGFLIGWTMGENMASVIDVSYIYDDETGAALAADSMAEHAAETEREYQSNQSIEV